MQHIGRLNRGMVVDIDITASNHASGARTDRVDRAFAEFYQREHEGQVRRAYLLLGSAGQAHDVVAEAFIAVLRRWSEIDQPGPYLSRCVLNGCRDSHRRRAREDLTDSPMQDQAVFDRIDDPADEMARSLLDLPFRQRAAIVLRFYGGLSAIEIARELDCQPGTVGSLIHRGLAALRQAMEPESNPTTDNGGNRR